MLAKPVRSRLLNSLLERLWNVPAARASRAPFAARRRFAFRPAESPAAGRYINAAQTLDVLRDFSSILTHSLNAEAMLRQFLLFLREILSVNRAAIFLNRPCTPLAETPVAGRQPPPARGVRHRPFPRTARTF